MVKLLKIGSTGHFVTQWQIFLRGQSYPINTTGQFDDDTFEATRQFQRRCRIDDDGIVGNQTLGKAVGLGLEIIDFGETEASYPARPEFPPLTNNAARQQLFGPLEFAPSPTTSNPERIRITNDWEQASIVKLSIPQLIGVEGAATDGTVHFHRKVAEQLRALWQAWADHGVLSRILTYSGDYAPRFVRGKAHEQVLSNHAFGTAFDINYAWNKLGTEPATAGTKGCVYDLVPIAHEFGFYWGGHFTRRDGMHFEVAKVMQASG